MQVGDGGRCLLGGEPFLLGLVEAFHFAAGLRVIRAGVVENNAEQA